MIAKSSYSVLVKERVVQNNVVRPDGELSNFNEQLFCHHNSVAMFTKAIKSQP